MKLNSLPPTPPYPQPIVRLHSGGAKGGGGGGGGATDPGGTFTWRQFRS